MSKNLFICILALTLSTLKVYAQVRLVVTVDSLLLPNKSIYVASSVNNWDPRNEGWKLKKTSANKYVIDIDEDLDNFEYKFTQGNWNNVEGRKDGALLPNRIYSKSEAINGIIPLKIEGWEHRPEFQIHVTKVPENTPKDAGIYITGNFNNWEVGDEHFKLEKQFDGSYKIKIFSKDENLEYKFNRGDWNSAESWKSGKARQNRILNKLDNLPNEEINVEIENWEDLSSTFNFFSIIDLLLLFAAFQGILLTIAIPTMQDFNKEANRWLVITLALATFFMFFRVVGNDREVANSFPKLVLIPNFVLFLFGPLFFFYLQKLLFKKTFSINQSIVHFILPFLLLIVYIPYFFMDGKRFQHKIVNNETDIQWVFAISFVIALFSNLYYYFASKKAIKKYSGQYLLETAYHQNINYLSTVLIIYLICIILGIFTCSIFLLNVYVGSYAELLENSTDLIWVAFSSIGYMLEYYAIHQPEIFKITSDETSLEENSKPETQKSKNSIAEENLDVYKLQLESIMQKQKPFLNPNLTLNELAGLMKIPSHALSKVIKEGYNMNFFDFVNSYRIEEFKENINNPKYHNYTLLGIAFEVGFNSKTAFNRSFKKITNETPSEYYQSRK